TGIHRDDALVEAGKAALVLGDQLRLERPGAVAWHINAQRTIVGQHRLAAASVAAVAAPTLGVGQVKAQLGPQRPLDHGLLELLENGLDPGRIHRARDQLLKKFRGQIDGPRDHRRLLLAWHTCSLVASWYASHTKFLTPSLPARDVRPYVRRNKTDRADAAGLVEAARCEQIADVPVKSPRQQGMQALHRVREQLKAQRTAAINLVR